MLNKDYEIARLQALQLLKEAHFVVTPDEKENMEIVDFGLGRLWEIGLQIIVYLNTQRACAKELILFPHQTCPEHRHPDVMDESGKEETFRCRWGKVYLYVPGEPASSPKSIIPEDKKSTFTVWNEIVLNPGDQYTLYPDMLHWFQSGERGAIVSEFSTTSRDEFDIFTDPEIKRMTIVEEE